MLTSPDQKIKTNYYQLIVSCAQWQNKRQISFKRVLKILDTFLKVKRLQVEIDHAQLKKAWREFKNA